MKGDEEESKDSTDALPKEGANALNALRNLWGATGRERAFFGPSGGGDIPIGRGTMENAMGGIGFGGLDTFAEDGEATSNTAAAGARLNAAWKKTLQAEGKMMHPGQSVSDLVQQTKDQQMKAAAEAKKKAKEEQSAGSDEG